MGRLDETRDQGPSQSAEGAAAYWCAREHSGALSRQEQEARERWLDESPEHRKSYERAGELWSGLGELAAHEEMRKLRQAALEARPSTRTGLPRKWAVAAGVMGVSLIGALAFRLHDGMRSPSSATALPSVTRDANHHLTAVGERSTFTLKDGSVVTLNTDSELWVRFNEGERLVEMTRGQGFFSVSQNKQRPFVVLAGGQRITALGTAFDVRVGHDAVQVVLVEGRVAVNAVEASTHRVELQPGERFVSASGKTTSVTRANLDASTSWRSGRIVFSNTSLADAVAEVNRYTPQRIAIADQGIGELQISGTYRVSEVERFPHALAAYYPLTVDTLPSGDVVLHWRGGARAK